MTTTYRLERVANTDLQFDGEIIANVSSREPGQPRWTEIRIYKTVTGRWVTEMIGRSINPGERDIPTVTVSNSAEQLRVSLLRTTGGRTFMTDVALDALEAAAKVDPAVQTAETI